MYRQSIQFPAKDAALREDVHALGTVVGNVLREQGGEEFFECVEGDRHVAIQRREGEAAGDAELQRRTVGRTPEAARDLTRAFSIWFQAVNTAEKVHRVRRRRQYLNDSTTVQPGGITDCIARLKREGRDLQQVIALIGSLSIEPVFTAHPTESTRRTILRKHQLIAQDLLRRLNPALTPGELRTLWAKVHLEFTTLWQTEDHPRERLTVADEREHVLFYLAEVLYRIVPFFYEEIEAALAQTFGVDEDSLDLPNILNFGSWVGGDMDGNPDVHAKSIRETLARHQRLIISTYYTECQQLAEVLSQSASRVGIDPALMRRVEQYGSLLPGAQAITPARHDRMPYRVFFGQIAERLKTTYDGRPNGYEGPAELLSDVQLVADSLLANHSRHGGYFLVRRLIRRIRTFGFHLATLDVRQHAHTHDEVIAQGMGRPDWPTLPSEQRLSQLRDWLGRDQGPQLPLDAVGRRTLWVFEAIAQARHKFGERGMRHYIISGATGPEDVLAVLLLARWADITDKRTGQCPLDIAPQFESIDSLNRAGDILQALLEVECYREHLAARAQRQVVVVGYSDGNKEGGILASRWALQVAQARIVEATRTHNVDAIIFHGRGGTPARGGGTTEQLVESTPKGAIRNVLRLTEQGEVVSQHYSLHPLAMRTLERSFAALARATAHVEDRFSPGEEQRAAMNLMAGESLAAYRRLVFEPRDFQAYFRGVTPIDVIERMHIAARPAAQEDAEGLQALRALPWVFAWTQSRHTLPGWYGMGTGLAAALERHGEGLIGEMLSRWPFFAHLFDDVEAMLARTDLEIAAHYDELVPAELRRHAGEIRAEYDLTVRSVLKLRGSAKLLDSDPTLQRAIKLRNPYIDPMHLMQVDLLKRWRATQRNDTALFQALLATISGIAQGLQATG
ncbi:MAG: phosphoenolpyruvate carboxylase [Steroidobacteraceae bacterium]